MSRYTDDILYLHMPKTGGTFVGRLLSRVQGGQKTDICHEPYRRIQAKYLGNRRVVGSIRNPWDWYVSWWQHGMADLADSQQMACYGRGSTEFRDVLFGATHPHEIDPLPEHIGCLWPMYRVPALRSARKAAFAVSKVGLWSWLVWDMYGDTTGRHLFVDVLIDTEHLYAGLSELLGVPVEPEGHPPQNTRHSRPDTAVEDPRGLYDAEMIRWVEEADGPLAHQFGYGEPFTPLPEKLLRLPGS